MKKLGIYTLINSENYGALLQSAALLHTCETLGYEVSCIATHKGRNYSVKHFIHKVYQHSRLLFGYSIRLNRTRLFSKRYLNIDSCLDIKTINDKYDKFIVGSDQVWNPSIVGKSTDFLLSHITENSKKISYAASFGVTEFPDFHRETYRKYITLIPHISVREKTGIDILNKWGINNAHVCVDPTLLLTKYNWMELLDIEIESKSSNYILCYLMAGNPSNSHIVKYAKSLAKKLHKSVKIIGEREYKRMMSSRYITTAGPKEFVNYVANADIVLTNSFHGTCFSLLFEKQFKSFIWIQPGRENRNSRILSLLELLDISNNVVEVTERSNTSSIDSNFHTNYMAVNKKLEEEREKSLTFIKKALTF